LPVHHAHVCQRKLCASVSSNLPGNGDVRMRLLHRSPRWFLVDLGTELLFVPVRMQRRPRRTDRPARWGDHAGGTAHRHGRQGVRCWRARVGCTGDDPQVGQLEQQGVTFAQRTVQCVPNAGRSPLSPPRSGSDGRTGGGDPRGGSGRVTALTSAVSSPCR
jgi:hypothetical protein